MVAVCFNPNEVTADLTASMELGLGSRSRTCNLTNQWFEGTPSLTAPSREEPKRGMIFFGVLYR